MRTGGGLPEKDEQHKLWIPPLINWRYNPI